MPVFVFSEEKQRNGKKGRMKVTHPCSEPPMEDMQTATTTLDRSVRRRHRRGMMMRSRQSDRARSRRAQIEDLNIRVDELELQKSTSVTGSSRSPTIVVDDDDDDDLHISSPRSFAQARSSGNPTRPRSRPVRENGATLEDRTSTDELLELRLGPTSCRKSAALRLPRLPAQHVETSSEQHGSSFTIDLTRPSGVDNDCILVHDFVQKKRKPANVTPAEPVKELRLTCAICMDTMKEETSTICGHIFCKQCILGAIAAQKKCPTCRQKLTNNLTHRIYISGSLRNP